VQGLNFCCIIMSCCRISKRLLWHFRRIFKHELNKTDNHLIWRQFECQHEDKTKFSQCLGACLLMSSRPISYVSGIIVWVGSVCILGVRLFTNRETIKILETIMWSPAYELRNSSSSLCCVCFNPLTPNSHYSGRTAPLTSSPCILNIYSTNIRTEYFKHTA
jgi:hypothetical protein